MGRTMVCINVIVRRSVTTCMSSIMAVTGGIVRMGGIGLPKMDKLHHHERKRGEEYGYPFDVAGQCHRSSKAAWVSLTDGLFSTYSGIL